MRQSVWNPLLLGASSLVSSPDGTRCGRIYLPAEPPVEARELQWVQAAQHLWALGGMDVLGVGGAPKAWLGAFLKAQRWEQMGGTCVSSGLFCESDDGALPRSWLGCPPPEHCCWQIPTFLAVTFVQSLSLSLSLSHTHTTNLVVGRKNLMLLEKGQAFPRSLCFSLLLLKVATPSHAGWGAAGRASWNGGSMQWCWEDGLQSSTSVFAIPGFARQGCDLGRAMEALSGSFSHPRFGPHWTEGSHKLDGTCIVFI